MICIIYITHTIQRSNREFDSTTIRIWPPISQQKKDTNLSAGYGYLKQKPIPWPVQSEWPQMATAPKLNCWSPKWPCATL